MVGGCRRLHNVELHNLYTCSTHGRDVRTKFWLENLNGRDQLKKLRVERIILKWMLGKQGGRFVLDASELG